MKINKTAVFSSLAAPAAGIAVTAILLFCWSSHPVNALANFLFGSFRSSYYFGTLLNTASLFTTAGIGAALAVKSGQLNLGGEGEIYAGGFTTALVLNALVPSGAGASTVITDASSVISGVPASTAGVPAFIALGAAFLCAAAAGAAMTTLCAALKDKRGANELLTTFLLSAAVIPLIDAAVSGRFRTTEGNLLATPFIAERLRLNSLLPPSPFNASFFISIVLCILSSFFVFKTVSGRRLQIWGKAPEFARYCGYCEKANTYGVMAASGAFHGITGFFAVCGTYYTCHVGFYAGLGWDALSCSLIAQANPALLVPVSLVLSWIFTSADRVALTENFGFDISSLIQGVVLISISLLGILSYKKKKSVERNNNINNNIINDKTSAEEKA